MKFHHNVSGYWFILWLLFLLTSSFILVSERRHFPNEMGFDILNLILNATKYICHDFLCKRLPPYKAKPMFFVFVFVLASLSFAEQTILACIMHNINRHTSPESDQPDLTDTLVVASLKPHVVK